MSSNISVVLVAVASVLVDASFRSEQYRDRINSQILLWLAASLQRNHDSSLSWTLVNLVFLSTISSAAYKAWHVLFRWDSSNQQPQEDYSRLLAPSLLAPLVYSLFQNEVTSESSDLTKSCFLIWTGSFVILCLWRWYVRQQSFVERTNIGMPLANNTNLDSDESCWESWTPHQVLLWIASQPTEMEICGILAPERISGSALPNVTAYDLRSLGVPYGPACELEKCIRDLVERFPPRNNNDSYQFNREEHRDVLVANGWIDQDSMERTKSAVHFGSDQVGSFSSFPDDVDDGVSQRAQAVMKERFGLELPPLKTSRNANDTNAPNAGITSTKPSFSGEKRVHWVDDTGEKKPHSIPQARVDPPPSIVPASLLDGMPPHIREIAARKPHLVQQLLARRQQQQQPTLSRVQELRMRADPSYASRHVGVQAAVEGAMPPSIHQYDPHYQEGEEDVNDEEDERVSLLKRSS